MNVLVTGNLGYVGSVLTRNLRSAGHRVYGYDIGYFDNATMSAPEQPDQQYYGDVRSFDPDVLVGIDAVIHLAALSNDPLGEINAQVTAAINVGGLSLVARVARAAGIGRFAFASSCSVYGDAGGNAQLDEQASQKPLTAYAHSKVDGEAVLRSLTTENFKPIALRFSTAFGYSPRPRLDLVVNNLVASGLVNASIVLESDGTPWRPLIHVEDMAEALRFAIESDVNVTGAHAYNVGVEAENYQIRTIADRVADHLGGLPVIFKPRSGPTDRRSYNVTFSKFRASFPAFRATWNLDRGIADLVERFRGNVQAADFEGHRYFRMRQLARLLSEGELNAAFEFRSRGSRPSNEPAPLSAS